MFYDDNEFYIITHEYLRSSAELARAAALCKEDPVKQEMIDL